MSSDSVTTVLVGQCGNQLGRSLFRTLASEAQCLSQSSSTDFQQQDAEEEYQESLCRSYFHPTPDSSTTSLKRTPVARAVLIDMEPKVVQDSIRVAQHEGLFSFLPQQCVLREEGSANNWAYGFCHQGPSRMDEICEQLRHQAEEAANRTFHVLHSVAGGTGSGVGCLVSSCIREMFPKAVLMHTVVWPFSSGEVVTQWFNSALCLSHLRDTADGVLVLSNDSVSAEIKLATDGGSRLKAVQDVPFTASYDTLNEHMSRVVSSLLLPTNLCSSPVPHAMVKRTSALHTKHMQATAHSSRTGAAILRPASPVADLLSSVVADPTRKFFHATLFPTLRKVDARTAQGTWSSVLHEAVRAEEQCKSFRSLYVLRGERSAIEGISELEHTLATGGLSNSFTTRRSLQTAECSFASAHNASCAATLATVDSRFGTLVSNGLNKLEETLERGAFIHHYQRAGGVEKGDLEDASIRCWDLVRSYQNP